MVNSSINFEYQPPNPYLYNFSGNITVDNGEKIPLDTNHFLLRGCSLRNSEFMYGLVGYTGPESKIMLNSVKARPKKSRVEKRMNFLIICIFVSDLLVCLFTAMGGVAWNNKKL